MPIITGLAVATKHSLTLVFLRSLRYLTYNSKGMDVVHAIENVKNADSRPLEPIRIVSVSVHTSGGK
jgi:hypothetical protein